MNFDQDNQIIQSPILAQIHDTITQTMKDLQEPYRIRIRRGKECEILRVFTVSTDYALRFSVLDRRPDNVHMTVQRFVTVFVSENRAGWNGEMTMDFPAKADGLLSVEALSNIAMSVSNYLALNSNSARSPRQGYPCVDNVDKAPSPWMAGSFTIEDVHVCTDAEGYKVKFLNHSHNLGITLKGAAAEVFHVPQGSVGCRAIIHQSGCVRVMRKTNFDQLYSLK